MSKGRERNRRALTPFVGAAFTNLLEPTPNLFWRPVNTSDAKDVVGDEDITLRETAKLPPRL